MLRSGLSLQLLSCTDPDVNALHNLGLLTHDKPTPDFLNGMEDMDSFDLDKYLTQEQISDPFPTFDDDPKKVDEKSPTSPLNTPSPRNDQVFTYPDKFGIATPQETYEYPIHGEPHEDMQLNVADTAQQQQQISLVELLPLQPSSPAIQPKQRTIYLIPVCAAPVIRPNSVPMLGATMEIEEEREIVEEEPPKSAPLRMSTRQQSSRKISTCSAASAPAHSDVRPYSRKSPAEKGSAAYLMKRKRNNKAVRESRRREKERIQTMADELESYRNENQRLIGENACLRNEVQRKDVEVKTLRDELEQTRKEVFRLTRDVCR